MSGRYSTKANLIAGTFLLAGVVLAVVLSFILADVTLARTRGYVIRFSVADGTTGLSPDAAVRVGGQQVGKVESIRVEKDGAGEYVVNVYVRVRADIEIYEDAWAHLEVPLLGTASTINIPYVGTGEGVETPQGESSRLEENEVIGGSVAPPLFLANAGFGPQQREQLQRMFTNAETAMQELSRAIESVSPRVEPMVEDLQATAASIRSTATGVEADYQTWRPRIDSTLQNVEEFTGGLGDISEESRLVLADAREMIRSGRAVVDDNRERIDNIFVNTDSMIAEVRESWVPRGGELLDETRATVEAYRGVGERADSLLATNAPGIENTLANLRIASDQLKFLAIEARAQPWRLLHRPDTKELENQLLYDSARSYAFAVSDLREVSESLETLVARTASSGAVDLGELQRMREKLQQAFETYAEAEADLLDRMIESNR